MIKFWLYFHVPMSASLAIGRPETAANRTYEGFLTNETVATLLWCHFSVKRCSHLFGIYVGTFPKALVLPSRHWEP
jgi:hypothetical protein